MILAHVLSFLPPHPHRSMLFSGGPQEQTKAPHTPLWPTYWANVANIWGRCGKHVGPMWPTCCASKVAGQSARAHRFPQSHQGKHGSRLPRRPNPPSPASRAMRRLQGGSEARCSRLLYGLNFPRIHSLSGRSQQALPIRRSAKRVQIRAAAKQMRASTNETRGKSPRTSPAQRSVSPSLRGRFVCCEAAQKRLGRASPPGAPTRTAGVWSRVACPSHSARTAPHRRVGHRRRRMLPGAKPWRLCCGPVAVRRHEANAAQAPH